MPSSTKFCLTVPLKEITSIGSILFTDEFNEAVRLVEGDTVDFEAITAARFPISDIQAACEMMADGRAVGKVLIKPEG